MKFIKLVRSENPEKKYDVYLQDGDKERKVSFGARGMSDFTKHRDEARKQLYINRHRATENWNDPLTAGFWAKNILWNKPTIEESLRDTKRRFNL